MFLNTIVYVIYLTVILSSHIGILHTTFTLSYNAMNNNGSEEHTANEMERTKLLTDLEKKKK